MQSVNSPTGCANSSGLIWQWNGTLAPRYDEEGMSELVFEVVQEADGRYCAECLTESIFTQAVIGDN